MTDQNPTDAIQPLTIAEEAARLSAELSLPRTGVRSAITLLDEGNTVPFIARYRKDQTGGIDDQQLRELEHELKALRELETKRSDTYRLITEGGQMTAEIARSIRQAATRTELEDIYRPFRPKRRTRAGIARELGLEPLADLLKTEGTKRSDLLKLAARLADPDKGIADEAAALQGAADILAEELSDDPGLRRTLRSELWREGTLGAAAKARKPEASADKEKEQVRKAAVYKSYEDWNMNLDRLKGHQVLALNRGEKEGFLQVRMGGDDEKYVSRIRSRLPRNPELGDLLDGCARDSWKRLIAPSLETEIRNELTARAEAEAVEIFAKNLKSTLLAPPLRGKTVLAFDPGYRNGCKLAVTAADGQVLAAAQIFPVKPRADVSGSSRTLDALVKKYNVEVLALGNGTATRETEDFIRQWQSSSGNALPLVIVNEAGASVYSASPAAAAELPDMDVSLRGAVSLARRLQDPLAELVKIEPAAIGVGQYQHDMDQKRLSERLGEVVEDSVNEVGVDLNTASVPLLSYISGITPAVARNIYDARAENGPFLSRTQLKKVPRLGPKAFEQCAGFLRIRDGKEALDNTSVHPESYEAARTLLKRLGVKQWTGNEDILKRTEALGVEKLADELGTGPATLRDIAAALDKPGRDSRSEREIVERSSKIRDLSDLKPGMKLPGVVRNVAAFGAFVDIGVHQDGLVHISELADRFVSDPSTVVQAGQLVEVTVLSVDKDRNRISLSMKSQVPSN